MKTLTHIKLQNNQSGAVLLVGLVLTVFVSILIGAAAMRTDVQVKETTHRQQLQEAFYAAETGVDTAIYNLRQNSSWKPGVNSIPAIVDKPFDITVAAVTRTIGYYSIEVADAPPFNGWESRWITATGKDRMMKVSRTIEARVLVESPTRFLISTLGPLRFTSGSELNADCLAKDVFFDVNDTLPSPQNEIHMNGDVYYINTKTGDSNPAVIWGSGNSIQRSPSITFAGVDLNRYQTLAQDLQTLNNGYYHDGNLTIDLANLSPFNPSPGNPFQPLIIYATGNINITGQYTHSILIVSAGNIYIDGDIVADATQPTIPQVGLFAKGDVLIPEATAPGGDLTIEGFILADGGTAGSKGTFAALGPKYSKNKLNFKGAISVRGNGTPTAVDLNVFRDRNYAFDPALSNNRTIPFTPFIVNTVQWQEI